MKWSIITFPFTLLAIALVVIGMAIASKVIGVYLGARLLGHRTHWTTPSFGVGLTARGGLEILVATLGLSLGILSQAMFAIIILIPMTTSLITPTLLRWALGHVQRSATGQIGLYEAGGTPGPEASSGLDCPA